MGTNEWPKLLPEKVNKIGLLDFVDTAVPTDLPSKYKGKFEDRARIVGCLRLLLNSLQK